MSEVQSRMAILLSHGGVQDAGISKALAELDDLQSKLRDLQSVEGDSDDIIRKTRRLPTLGRSLRPRP